MSTLKWKTPRLGSILERQSHRRQKLLAPPAEVSLCLSLALFRSLTLSKGKRKASVLDTPETAVRDRKRARDFSESANDEEAGKSC